MKYSSKWKYTNIGDTRVILKFLLIPKKIEDEWRWLEKAMYTQECVQVGVKKSRRKWQDKRWEDEHLE